MQKKRNIKYFEQRLNEQIKLLKKRVSDYKVGDEIEAYQIATILRTLLHDTKNSKSIFKHVGIKDKVYFFTCASPYLFINLIPYTGLVIQKATTGKGFEYVSNMESEDKQIICVKFEDWWNQIIIDDKQKRYTRADIVKYIANKEGACHLQEEVDEDYDKLFNENTIGFIYFDPFRNEESGPLNNLLFISLYVIAQELLNSIEFFKYYYKKEVHTTRKKHNNLKVFMHKDESQARVFTISEDYREYLFKGSDELGFKMAERELYEEKIETEKYSLTRIVII